MEASLSLSFIVRRAHTPTGKARREADIADHGSEGTAANFQLNRCQMIAVTISNSISVGTTLNIASRNTDWMLVCRGHRTRQRTGLPIKMKAQAQRMQMAEGAQCGDAHGALLHLGEQRIA